jgi:uncharacterized Fe-S cluster protein YjdI
MEKSDREYSNGKITVYWKPGKCIHATTCYRELNEVFNPRNRPWVNINGATSEEIIKVVKKCPTKALDWKWNDPVQQKEEEEKEKAKLESESVVEAEEKPVTVNVMKDGPILIQGKFTIYNEEGNVLKTLSMTSLCRCGHSRVLPFCDGSHRKHAFIE